MIAVFEGATEEPRVAKAARACGVSNVAIHKIDTKGKHKLSYPRAPPIEG
jgi:hypothetical protein